MTTSFDYDEKIHKLFQEGQKLGASGLASLDHKSADIIEKTGVNNSTKQTPARVTVSSLEDELSHQAKEASRLQQELNSARDNIQHTGEFIANGLNASAFSSAPLKQYQSHGFQPIRSELNSNSNNNNHVVSNKPLSYPSFQPNEVASLTNTKIHLENALEDSQAQVEYLTNKLDNMKKSMDEQKDRFRHAVEELQGKLHDTVAGRKKLLELRQQDMHQQEETIHRLQTTLKELAASNQMQEQALLDAHERMEIMDNRNQTNERAMTRIRSVINSTTLKDAAGSKLSSFSNSDHISELVPEMLIDNLEKFVNASTGEADSLRSKVLQLEAELNATKQAHEADRMLANSDAVELASKMKTEHQLEMEQERTRRKEAEDSLTLLTNELKKLQVDNTAQVKLVAQSHDQITDLHRQLDELRHVHCSEKGDLQSKLVCMEYDVKSLNDKHERLVDENQSYKSNNADLNNRLQLLSVQLNSEKESRATLASKESQLSEEVHEMRSDLEKKNSEIHRLREIAAQLRGDFTTKVAKEINEAENVERMKADERISAISKENIGLREDLSRARASLEAVERQLSTVSSEKTEAMQMVKEKDRQVDRLTSQLSLSDRKLIEATEARKTADEKLRTLQADHSDVSRTAKQSHSDLERQRAVTDDKERIAMSLRNQLEKTSELLRVAEQKMNDAAKTRDQLAIHNKEQQDVIDQLKSELKSKEDELIAYESRLKNVVGEKDKVARDVRDIEDQISNLISVKKETEAELKECRHQLSRLIEERDELSKEVKSTREVYGSEIEKLTDKLEQKKADLKLFQDAVHSVKAIDGKAAIMASHMQKEVSDKRGVIDTLQSELSNVYDKLETELRDLKRVKKENVKLQKQIEETKENYRKAEQELRNKTKSEKNLSLALERLEAALEKAAERNVSAQLVINRQEAELSKAHIRRNLDMMDKRLPAAPMGLTDERLMLQNNPSTNAFGRPSLSPGNNTVLQNMLARILSAMTAAQPRHDDVTPPPKPAAAAPAESKPPANMSTEDIYKILAEVREQLAKHDDQHHDAPREVKRLKRHNRDKSRQRNFKYDRDIPIVSMHTDATSACSETTLLETESSCSTLPDNRSHDMLMTSSPLKRSDDVSFLNPPSPVSMLLAGGENAVDFDGRDQSFSPIKKLNPRRGDSHQPEKQQDVRDKFVKDAISDNAEELCQQLQDRLEGLSRIGGKLERQNKVAAKLMKKQDEKLKRVRQSKQFWR